MSLTASNLLGEAPLHVGVAMASTCWGGAVCCSWRPHWREFLVASLAASLAPVTLARGNLPGGVLPARRRGDGLSLLGGGPSAALSNLISAITSCAGLATFLTPAALTVGSLLVGAPPVRWNINDFFMLRVGLTVAPGGLIGTSSSWQPWGPLWRQRP